MFWLIPVFPFETSKLMRLSSESSTLMIIRKFHLSFTLGLSLLHESYNWKLRKAWWSRRKLNLPYTVMQELLIYPGSSQDSPIPWLHDSEDWSVPASQLVVELCWSKTVEQVHHGKTGLRNGRLHWGLCCGCVGVYAVFIFVECVGRRALLFKSWLNIFQFWILEMYVLLDLLISLPKHDANLL